MTYTLGDDQPSLSATVAGGDTRASLAALRDLIARTLDACEVRHLRSCECECGPPPPKAADVAALSARLADVLLRLDKLPAAEGVSIADELKRRREARLANAAGS